MELVFRPLAEDDYDNVLATLAARHRGVARQLYERVFDLLRDRGCCRVEAVTVPENAGSLLFHERMGFAARGHDGPLRQAPIVRDHSGAGQDRVVLRRGL